MTRREFVSAGVGAWPVLPHARLVVPVLQVRDTRARCTAAQLHRFSSSIWPEAVRDFHRCGVELRGSQATGEVRRSPGGRPVFAGLEHGVVNLVITDHVPLQWDNGRGLAGVSTRRDGYDLCLIALSYAHSHQVPFVSVNTCVHELLHVFFEDILVSRPEGLPRAGREFRIAWHATRLWLFQDGAAVRKAAQAYLKGLGPAKTL